MPVLVSPLPPALSLGKQELDFRQPLNPLLSLLDILPMGGVGYT